MLTDLFAFRGDDSPRTDDAGVLTSVVAYARILTCGDTAGFVGDERVRVHIDEIESRLGSPTAAVRRKGYVCSVRSVDPLSLSAGNDLPRSFSIAFGERKYFAGQSLIKISDNIHSPPLLWDTVIGAVNTTPFQTVPQLMNRGEDRSESFPLGVIE